MLTEQMRSTLAFIVGWTETHDGVPPSYEEIRRGIGVASKSNVARLISQLEARDCVRRCGRPGRAGARSLQVLRRPEEVLPPDEATVLMEALERALILARCIERAPPGRLAAALRREAREAREALERATATRLARSASAADRRPTQAMPSPPPAWDPPA